MTKHQKAAMRERVRHNLRTHGEGMWLAQRRFRSANLMGRRIVDIVRFEAAHESSIVSGEQLDGTNLNRDAVFGMFEEPAPRAWGSNPALIDCNWSNRITKALG